MGKNGRAGETTDGNKSGMRRMSFASWITEIKDTHSEYVILNAFPERASMLRRI